MEYQKNKFAGQYTKSTVYVWNKKWNETNAHSRWVYNANSDIRFKTTMLTSSLCNYSDAYILVKEKTTNTGAGDAAAARQAVKK